MKKVFLLLMLTLLVFLFFSSEAAALACKAGIELFCARVLPTLLPFLIASGVLSRMGAANAVGKRFRRPFQTLFHLPGESAFVFASGILCGNPVASQATANLLEQGKLSPSQARRTAALCAFVSPAFLMGTVSGAMLGEPSCALPLAAGHYLGAILTGMLFALPHHGEQASLPPPAQHAPALSPAAALTASISAAASVLPQICAYIAFFSVLIAALESFHFFSLFQGFPLVKALVTSFFELTTGCAALAACTVPRPLQLACISFALSFGGLCVFCQNAAFLSDHKIRLGHLFFFRIVHGMVSFLITYLISM